MKKSFEEIYSKISSESMEEIETERKKKAKIQTTAIFIGVGLFLLSLIVFRSANFILIMFPIVVGIIISRFSTKYTTIFKDKVIKTFIKEYDENLVYMPNGGIHHSIYDDAEFENYDVFYSEDYIEGILDGKFKINMAEVNPKNISRDSDGDTTETSVFHGLFASIESPRAIDGSIRIHSNSGFLDKLFSSKNKLEKVEMDSTEFEKNFDVYAKNKVMAMQILTSDVMSLLLDFKSKYKISYEITLKENHIYIRFNTGAMFEPEVFKNSLDKQLLQRYYNIINFTLDLCKVLNKTVEETEI